MITAIVLLVSLFLFLFFFFLFTKDDFYFIRKGIVMDQLFDILLKGIFFSFIISRVVFVIFHFKLSYLNPLVFFLVPYFPGLSLFGGIVGLYVSLPLFTKHKKLFMWRLLDYVSLSILPVMPIILIFLYNNVYLFILYLVLFLMCVTMVFPVYTRGELREGIISLFFLVMFSLISLLYDIFMLYSKNVLLQKEDFLLLALFFISAMMLIRLQYKRKEVPR